MSTAKPLQVERSTHASSLQKAMDCLWSHQSPEGYWCYTLEANEAIASGFIQVMHFLGEVDPVIQEALVRRMLAQQKRGGPDDGSWAIYFDGPGDLSTTIECYLALRLSGRSPEDSALKRARRFILQKGGLLKMRAFSRIHLALFGLAPWSSCPSMPIWFFLMPPKLGVSIYEFSSWARASIVPLLLLDAKKPIRPVPFDLDELYCEPPSRREFCFPKPKKTLSLENFFIQFDKVLKLSERLPWHPGRPWAIQRAEQWTREHLSRTEDIYPAMAYAILGLSALGYPNDDPTIRKALNGLKGFQQSYSTSSPPTPLLHNVGDGCQRRGEDTALHQQCCISPNWDTPWAAVALLEAGASPDDPRLQKAARYMISKEVHFSMADWKVKNPRGPVGGWSFEFENDYFPDVDDTIEALQFLTRVELPPEETEGPIQRGLDWMLSMQCKNGGWAAFDKNNTSEWVNKIPFSDHGACLDPPTPDITGRMLELLASIASVSESRAAGSSLASFTSVSESRAAGSSLASFTSVSESRAAGSGLASLNMSGNEKIIQRALEFLFDRQEADGSWRGRWGVNYIYGTWCVLQGLAAIGSDVYSDRVKKASAWLRSIQNEDGGWGESCRSDEENRYVPLGVSTASQTAWAIMGLVAAGETHSSSVKKGIAWLTKHQNADGGWDESHFTGTGFPGHFYIRYHGYRYYFPALALAKYVRALD